MNKTLKEFQETIAKDGALIAKDPRFLRFLAVRSDTGLSFRIVKGEASAVGLPAQDSFACDEIKDHIELDHVFTEILGPRDYLNLLKKNFHPESTSNVFLLPIKRETTPLWLLVRVYALGETADGDYAFGGEVVHIHKDEPFSMKLYKTAHTDDPTGLYNREALRQHIMRMDNHNKLYGMFIDIDDFKEINDLYGHYHGDRTLEKVAHRLKQLQNEHRRFYRIGGDEFFVVVRTNSSQKALGLANELIRKFQNVEIEGKEMHLTASIGVIRLPKERPDFDTLLKKADAAMYEAKRKGKGRVVYKD